MLKSLGFVFLCIASCACAAAEFRVAVISDLNSSYASTDYHQGVDRAVQRIIQLKPDLVISTGDMVAGQRLRPLLTREEIEPMWQSFHQTVTQPLAAAGVPLLVTPGNHDGSAYARFQLERSIYAGQWLANKPQVEFVDDAHYPFYYAFALQDVLFVSLDATMPGALKRVQRKWLTELLTEIDGKYARKILFSHLPLWPFSQQRETEALFDHDLEQLLQEYKVDLYLSGHHHAYYPGYKDGIRYLSQACLGAGPRYLIGDTQRSQRSITLMTFSAHNGIEVEALVAPKFTSSLSLHSLPEEITSPQATLIREDLVEQTAGSTKP